MENGQSFSGETSNRSRGCQTNSPAMSSANADGIPPRRNGRDEVATRALARNSRRGAIVVAPRSSFATSPWPHGTVSWEILADRGGEGGAPRD